MTVFAGRFPYAPDPHVFAGHVAPVPAVLYSHAARSDAAACRGVADAVAIAYAPEFVTKWRGDTRKEHSVAQEHFIDLCRMIGHRAAPH
jgi:hypothetical protein